MIVVAEDSWLTFDEAVELVRERYSTSPGKAQAIVRDAFSSDEIRNTRVTGEALDLLLFDGTTLPPPRLSKADLLYRLDQEMPSAPLSAPTPRTPAPRASGKQIREVVAEYLRTNPNPTMDGAVEYAEGKGLTGHRPAVRGEYSEQAGRPGPGRRRKNNPPK